MCGNSRCSWFNVEVRYLGRDLGGCTCTCEVLISTFLVALKGRLKENSSHRRNCQIFFPIQLKSHTSTHFSALIKLHHATVLCLASSRFLISPIAKGSSWVQFLSLGALLALSTGATAVTSSHTSPTVNVRNGTYVGTYSSSYNQDFFLGMPYAQPPTEGPLRFAPPAPLNTSWDGIRSATEFGHIRYS